MEETKNENNEYLRTLLNIPSINIEITIAEFKAKKKQLEDKKFKPLKLQEKFTRAKMEEDYKTLYNMLCCESHNNLTALINRHFVFKESDHHLTYYKELPITETIMYLGINLELFLKMTKLIHDFFKSSPQEKISNYSAKLNELKSD